jgi:hypothetical protein
MQFVLLIVVRPVGKLVEGRLIRRGSAFRLQHMREMAEVL